jgi:tRNA (guanosine-2'-O-)-methyltransferase
MLKSNNQILDHLWKFLSPERQALFLKKVEDRTKHVTLAIENIYQPHNASAVMRSADCFGVSDVHIIENDNEYILNPNVTMGSAKWLDIHRYNEKDNNTKDSLENLKANGYKLLATTPHGESTQLDQLSLDRPVALLFGTELTGLTEEALDMADETLRIPMYGFTESFNISVSAAICLYDITRRLHDSEIGWKLTGNQRTEMLLSWARRSIKDSVNIEKRFLEG